METTTEEALAVSLLRGEAMCTAVVRGRHIPLSRLKTQSPGVPSDRWTFHGRVGKLRSIEEHQPV